MGVGAAGCAVGDGFPWVGFGLAVAAALGAAVDAAVGCGKGVTVAGTSVGSGVAVASAAGGRGVLVGVGVAAGAAGPQAASVAPNTITAMIRSQDQAGLMVKRDRIINVHLRICQVYRSVRYFDIPCRMP
jgi:hypothetical protein